MVPAAEVAIDRGSDLCSSPLTPLAAMKAAMWPASSSHALHLLLLASLMAAASAQGSWQSGTIGELGYGTVSRQAWEARRHLFQ